MFSQKSSIADVWLGSKYATVQPKHFFKNPQVNLRNFEIEIRKRFRYMGFDLFNSAK